MSNNSGHAAPTSDDELRVFPQQPQFARYGNLEGPDSHTPSPRAADLVVQHGLVYHRHSHSPTEIAVTGSSRDQRQEAEQDPTIFQQGVTDYVSPSSRPDAPQSAPRAPHIHVSGPGMPTSSAQDISGTLHPSGYGTGALFEDDQSPGSYYGNQNSYLPVNPYLPGQSAAGDRSLPHIRYFAPTQPSPAAQTGTPAQLSPSFYDAGQWGPLPGYYGRANLEGNQSEGLPDATTSHYLPADPSSSGGRAEAASTRAQPFVPTQPVPFSQPPASALGPYQHGGYSGAQHAGQFHNPHQQATRQPKRTHNDPSRANEEDKQRKAKRRRENDLKWEPGPGQTADQNVYNLTEKPDPGATSAVTSQAGGMDMPQTQGESSAQGVLQHQNDPARAFDPVALSFNQIEAGDGVGFAQPQGGSNSGGAGSRRAVAPTPVPRPATEPPGPPRLHGMSLPWTPDELNTLELIMSTHQSWEEVKEEVVRRFGKCERSCRDKWRMMGRYWAKWEDASLRILGSTTVD